MSLAQRAAVTVSAWATAPHVSDFSVHKLGRRAALLFIARPRAIRSLNLIRLPSTIAMSQSTINRQR